ncbi:hypothetical protein [Halobacteriovorax sp. JY17]|uniref:hypothetical protein n=1 Tax=Halobacteriovorax sp. JY17 TaxID=2014617 RepID=UPI000C5458B3|nr:hypothetical protein [Halobacteriovorax sp. JY17]PIK15685.1 MAG: hypothetical protein CES88_02865 [Halobacteriovorax sp. JY17]
MKLALHTLFAILCLVMADISFADEFAAQREACNKDSSRKWDLKLNRCMTSKDTKRDLEAYRNCTLFEKKADRDKCMRDLVIEVSGDAKLEDTNWDALLMDSISFGITVSNLGFRGKKSSPCLSAKVGAACSGIAMLKTLYIMQKAKKETKENLASFQEKVKDEENYDTQVIAYQSQIDQLKSLAKYYDMKQKLNKLVAACYLGTAAAALKDNATFNQSCEAVEETDAAGEEIKKVQIDNKVATNPALGPQVAAAEKATKMYLRSPAGIALLALANTGWNLIKAKKLQEQGEKADLLAKRAKIAKDQFITAMGKYCPGGHDDKNNLMCYCYEKGEKKTDRTNSQSCQALWAKNERNLFAESSDKTRASDDAGTKMGCLTQAGAFDPSCQCRKFKDAQGNNACRKTSFSTIQLGGLGQAMDVKQLEADLNNVTSGITAAQGFDLTPAQSSALSGNIRDQILKQVQVQDKSGLRPASSKDLATIEKALLSGITRELAASPLAADPFDKDLQEIQKEVEATINSKKVAEETSKLKMTGGKGAGINNKKKQNFALNLGNSSSNVESYPEYMNKTYKTENADVVTNKDVSIFKVLSNRYYKSGFKRLFDQ